MNGGIVYEQRDIVLVPFPYTDLTHNKKRPAILLSNVIGDDFLCCLVTSKATEGLLLDDLEGSLPLKSWVKPHRIFTVDKRIVHKKLCSITPALHENIISKILEHLELK